MYCSTAEFTALNKLLATEINPGFRLVKGRNLLQFVHILSITTLNIYIYYSKFHLNINSSLHAWVRMEEL